MNCHLSWGVVQHGHQLGLPRRLDDPVRWLINYTLAMFCVPVLHPDAAKAPGEVDACITSPCKALVPTPGLNIQAFCEDLPGSDNTTSGRKCTCQQPGRPDFMAVWDDDYGCLYSKHSVACTAGVWQSMHPA